MNQRPLHHSRVLALLLLCIGMHLGPVTGAQAQDAAPPDGYVAPAPEEQGYAVEAYEQAQYRVDEPEVTAAEPRRVVVPYQHGMTIPEAGYLRSRSRNSIWIPGLAIFVSTYFITGGVGTMALGLRDQGSNAQAWVPIVGGYLAADNSCGRKIAAASILAQSAGLAMFIVGLAVRHQELVYYTERGRGLMFGASPTRGGAMLSLNVF